MAPIEIIIAVLSCLIGIIGTYIMTKWQMRKNSINHIFINSYDIGKGLSSEFPEFSLTFEGEPLLNDVRVLKGEFVNVGRNDIDNFNGISDIMLILPEECCIKAIKVKPSNEKLIVVANKDNTKENVVSFGISEFMRPNEYFSYTAIIEVTNNIEDIHNKLQFDQRIKGTEKGVKNINSYQKSVNKFRSVYYFAYIALFLISLFPDYLLIDFFPNLDRKPLVILFIVIGFLIWNILLFTHMYLVNNSMRRYWKKSPK